MNPKRIKPLSKLQLSAEMRVEPSRNSALIQKFRKRSIAVIGGGFDPIHHGHLTAAQAVFDHLRPDYVLFMPTGKPPHKQTETYAWHRYFMTLLATADNPRFFTSSMEIERGGLSYTIDTLRELRRNLSGAEDADGETGGACEIYFVVGADEIVQLSDWKESENLLREFKFIACTRPGYKLENCPPGVELLTISALEISGTDIRRRIKDSLSARYLIPASAAWYIDSFGLYKNSSAGDSAEPTAEAASEAASSIEDIQRKTSEKLSAKRYKHTIGVIETALLLAYRYEADPRKAYLAALLHDYHKEEPEEEKRRLCAEYNFQPDEIQARYINLTHGMLGAETARREFGIEDGEILRAIRYHTTGSADMSLLGKIIKLSDAIEPYRRNAPHLAEIRKTAFLCINAALKMSMQKDMDYNIGLGRTVHPMSLAAIESLS